MLLVQEPQRENHLLRFVFFTVLRFGVVTDIYLVSLIKHVSPHFLRCRYISDLKILDIKIMMCFKDGWGIAHFKVIWAKA